MPASALHVIIPSSDYYAPYTAVLLTSVILNKKENDRYFFHILTEDMSEYSMNALRSIVRYGDFEIEFKFLKKELIKDIVACIQSRIGDICNYKLFISSLFPFDRVVVLEGDMIVLESLRPLFDIDMENCPMAAVKDPICNEIQHLFNIPKKYRYCNTGMFVANLDFWRQNNSEREFLKCARKYRSVLELPDQDIFNRVFFRKMKYLPLRYNVYVAVSKHNFPEEMKESEKNPAIIHWADYQKPWCFLTVKYAYLFWEYARKSPMYEIIMQRMLLQSIPPAPAILPDMKKLKRKLKSLKLKYFFIRKKKYEKKIDVLKKQLGMK